MPDPGYVAAVGHPMTLYHSQSCAGLQSGVDKVKTAAAK